MNAMIAQSDVVTAYGWGLDALWNGLLSGKTAIGETERFAERGFVSRQAAMIPGLEVERGQSRVMAMLARLLLPLVGKIDPYTPVILATTVGEIEYVERAVLEGRPELAGEARPQFLLERVKRMLGLRGMGMVISSACASSAAAMTRAASMVRHGEAERVLVVTCDAISEFVYSGFSSLLSLCEEPARPFDVGHCGLTLGEAAAWAMVSSEALCDEDADATAILGWGNTTDAVHMTAPDRHGGGLSRAIRKACKMAEKEAGAISFIAAHGTATPYSDAMELCAFEQSMNGAKPIFSIKGGIGHPLAAAGMAQILVAGRAILEGVVPATVGLSVADPVARGWAGAVAARIDAGAIAMSTNSGFGGVNTAILLGGRTRR